MESKSTIRIKSLFATTVIAFLIGSCSSGKSESEVTDFEVRQLTEYIFDNENEYLQNHVQKNLQSLEKRRHYVDNSPEPLLTVDQSVLEIPLLNDVRKLFDNYQLDTRKPEVATPLKNKEEETLLEDLLNTTAIHKVMNFLSDRGFIREGNETYKEILRDVWFHQFARQRSSNVRGSSGFEHIFLGELKSGDKLIGLHNWIFFNTAESSGRLNYWGYRRFRNLGNSTASVAEVVYSYSGKTKMSGMFIGTSPELEIAVYTLCYFVRPNRYCRISMGGTKFGVQTYVINHSSEKPSLGSAYPVIN